MISREEILKGQDCPPEFETNLQNLLDKLNKFRVLYAHPMIVTSGLRSKEHNAEIGGALNSAHLSCEAADFQDVDRKLTLFCVSNLDILEQLGLWMEDPNHTASWVHLQSRPAKQRIFKP